jgi:glycosyltransferase involved in cell wall biosynthesis
MKVLLVGNYFLDRQHSMQRFARMLRDGLRAQGHEVRLIRPWPRLGRVQRFGSMAQKWLGYIDKFLLFPDVLRRAVDWADVVHICDHSNAMYVAALKGKPQVVTCHDLLAVRGALGESTDCPASVTGKLLQRWILRSLRRAQMIACVSSATRADLLRLAGEGIASRSCVVLLGVTPSVHRVSSEEAQKRLTQLARVGTGRPFLLNVGSNLRRKNREGTLRIFKAISERFDCDLVLAGEPLSAELKTLSHEIGLNGNVIEVSRPSDAELEALYSNAFALLYPTKFEGFGWPAIEAQMCGCPVVSSASTSLPEVLGDSGLLRAPDDEQGFASDVLKLTDTVVREEFVARGFENVKRFTPGRMTNDYLQLYQKVCAQGSN